MVLSMLRLVFECNGKESWEEKDVELVAMHQSNQMIIKNVRMSLKSTPENFLLI